MPTPPAAVELEFIGPPQTLGTEVTVTGPDRAAVTQGAAEVGGTTVVQALAADLPAGEYTVDWRVVSSDGHPLTGTFAFTSTGGTTSAAEAAEPSLAARAGAPSAAPSADSSPSTTLVAVAAVLVFGLVGTVAVRRLRSRP